MSAFNTHNPSNPRVSRVLRELEVSLYKVMCDIGMLNAIGMEADESRKEGKIDDAELQAIEAAIELMEGWEWSVLELQAPLLLIRKNLNGIAAIART